MEMVQKGVWVRSKSICCLTNVRNCPNTKEDESVCCVVVTATRRGAGGGLVKHCLCTVAFAIFIILFGNGRHGRWSSLS